MNHQRKVCVTIGIKPSLSDCEAEVIQQRRATTTVKKITTFIGGNSQDSTNLYATKNH